VLQPNSGPERGSPDVVLSEEGVKKLAALKNDIVKFFKFNFKVYQPVYAQLVVNFQQKKT
jgi:hypothetical protein